MSTTISENFSANLRRWRGTLSQLQAARSLGLGSQQAYQRYETGVVPRAGGLQRLADRMGVKPEDLLRANGVAAGAPGEQAGGGLALPLPAGVRQQIEGAAAVLGMAAEALMAETIQRHWRETARALRAGGVGGERERPEGGA